jgi:hypothetical protein
MTQAEEETHYVVTISLKKVTRKTKSSDYEIISSPREKSTLANITVSAKTIEEMRTKVNAHVNLIGDGGDIE